jgi:hypothetical protein
MEGQEMDKLAGYREWQKKRLGFFYILAKD